MAGFGAAPRHAEIEAGTADPRFLSGFGELLAFMSRQFGAWPSALNFFGAMQIPIGIACWRVWGPKAGDSDDSRGREAWTPRLEQPAAKKILLVLLILFHAAAAALVFKLLPVAVCAVVLAVTVVVGVIVQVCQSQPAAEGA